MDAQRFIVVMAPPVKDKQMPCAKRHERLAPRLHYYVKFASSWKKGFATLRFCGLSLNFRSYKGYAANIHCTSVFDPRYCRLSILMVGESTYSLIKGYVTQFSFSAAARQVAQAVLSQYLPPTLQRQRFSRPWPCSRRRPRQWLSRIICEEPAILLSVSAVLPSSHLCCIQTNTSRIPYRRPALYSPHVPDSKRKRTSSTPLSPLSCYKQR